MTRVFLFRSISVIVAVLAVTVSGCRTCLPAAERPAVPDDFLLSFGRGGGFSGAWSGTTVLASGAVWTWSGRAGARDSTLSHVLPRAAVDSLWRGVLQVGLFERSSDRSGNLTARIRVRGAGRSQVLSWPSTLEPGPGDSLLESYYRKVEPFVRSFRAAPPGPPPPPNRFP